MNVILLINWFIYLLIGSIVGGALGTGMDAMSIISQHRRVKFHIMVINYLDILFETVVRFLSIPMALIAISWIDVLIPGGSMKSITGFGSFIFKLGAIILILVYAIKLKIPPIAKPNEMERMNTRGGILLGALLITVYFCYHNFSEVKQLLSACGKLFGL